MSIYADKRNGKKTGRWCVEVRRGNRTLRDRADSYSDAKALERSFIGQLEGTSGGDSADAYPFPPERLSDLIDRAERSLWVGKDCASDNFKKLRFVVETLGDCMVDEINTKKVDELVERLKSRGPKGRPLGDATINRYLAALSKFLKWAAERGYRQSALPKIEWMDEDEGRIRWITPEEEAKLYKLLPTDVYRKLVRVAIRTGMRRSEIYETLEGTTGHFTNDHVHLWKTKNRKARSVPITPETYEDLVFLKSSGLPTERQLRYEWDKAKDAMGLATDEDFVFHACRHTFCTRLVQAGVDIRIIKELAGHKSLQTTLRYAHVSRSDLRQAVDKVSKLFA